MKFKINVKPATHDEWEWDATSATGYIPYLKGSGYADSVAEAKAAAEDWCRHMAGETETYDYEV